MGHNKESRSRQQNIVNNRQTSSPHNTVHRQRPSGRKNSTVKIILWIVLVLQIVIMIELFMLIRVPAANEEYMGRSNAALFTNGQEENSSIYSKNQEGIYSENWNLVLINKWNAMEPGYVPELTEVADGHYIDCRIAGSLQDMIKDAGKAGHSIYIISAYRDMDKQTYLYEAEVEEWLEKGYSQSGAEREAAKVVAYPGTSEHHLGLAVDLVSSEHVALDEKAELTKGYQWLVKHCHEYGFILRYPNGATEITGIIYEPWHFRYVGEEAAGIIMAENITLEEYLEEVTGGER